MPAKERHGLQSSGSQMMEESCSEKHRKKGGSYKCKMKTVKKYLGMTLRDASEVNN